MQEVITENKIVQGYRLSTQQERLWRLQQDAPGQTFRAVCAISIEGTLDAAALKDALSGVVQRHEIFRTGFHRRPELRFPVQVIDERAQPLWRTNDLRGLSAPEQEVRIEELFGEEKDQPVDFDGGSPLRATLLTLSDQRNVLIVSLPSLCADARTLRNLVTELAAGYGTSLQTETEVAQYVEFSEWQHELLSEEESKAGQEFWKQQATLTQPALPLENKLAPDVEFDPDTYSFKIDPESLRALLSQQNVTESEFLLACWQSLLSRITGHTEIVSGYLHEGRSDEALTDACGPFAKRLPVLTKFSEPQIFTGVLQQIRRSLIEAEKWQDYCVNENLLSFGFEFEERSPISAGDLTFTIRKQYVCDEPFRVRFACVKTGEDLHLELHYDKRSYRREDIARLAEEFQTLVASAVANPETPLAELEIVGAAEALEIIANFNNTNANYSTAKTLHELFERRVELSPKAIAVEHEDQQLSYAELNARTNQLAHYLRGIGVGPDVLVGVLMERSVEMVVGLLAILKAGGAYVPVDPEYPAERIRFMLDDSGVHVLLTQSRLVAALPEHTARIICLDSDWSTIATERSENLSSTVTADNLAYVIYTSGSTGRPKGAMVHHGGVINCLCWMQETYQLNETDKFIFKTSLNFDPSVWELFWTLWVGATVCIARPGGQLDNAYLIEQIQKRGCTSIYFVPSMLRVFLEEPGVELCHSLKRVICGGEALARETIDRFYKLLPAELHHSYGPTETSIAATEWTCEPQTERRIVPMGFPLANTQTYVMDHALRLVPIGVMGELYIGGLGLGRGYLNRTELTAERFIPDPLSRVPGARLYKTGDLVRFLADGSLEFAGRVDHQVKLRGFRIELGEIEAQLSRHPAIKETVVIAREDRPGEKRLVAYIVGSQEQSPPIDDVREFLQAHLPEYMVPAAFVVLKALPLMHNGKVDRRQLPEPEQSLSENQQHFVAPRTTIEEMLAMIWSELLGVDQIGIHHNFFDLGGHSLLGTQLISRVRKTFQIEIPLRTLFDSPTIASMAQTVEVLLRDEQLTQAPPLVPMPRDAQLPLSFAQQRLWFLDQLQPGNPFYNLYSAVRLQGELDVFALEQSFNEVVRRHEALRTVFPNVNGKPAQVIMPAAKLALHFKDLREQPETEREAEAMRLATEDVQRPFDLTRGPLLRLTLMQTGEQEHMLVLCIHHIVSDGWSSRVLIRELVLLYEDFSTGQRSHLAELPIQYADYARWQREWLQGGVLEAQLDYWRKQLSGAPAVLELPIAKARPAVQTFRGARVPHLLPREISAAIEELSRREGVTQFMILLAAFQVLLSRYSGQDDIVVGTPIAGRGRIETEDLIGFFVNTLVLRTDLAGNPSFQELLRRVREVALGAAAHQDLPFEKLVEELQPERDLNRTPLFQVMFALQNVPRDSYELPNLTLSAIGAETGAAKFDLTLFFHPTGEGLLGILEYNTDLFDAESIQSMWRHFETLLRGLIEHSEQQILSLPLLNEAERRQVLVDWNDTATAFPHDACFPQLFEEQVKRTPEAIAVASGKTNLTYDELNQRANRLAGFLAGKGIGPETVVAVLAPRGISLLTAILAIFKTGAAYLPLDPRHPAARHVQVLTQSRASMLLVAEDLEPVVAQVRKDTLQIYQLEQALNTDAGSDNPELRSGPRNLAYVIFTSGSTGLPKGAMIEQRGMINHLYIKMRDLDLKPADIVAQTASQCFDISVWQFLAPLLVGAQVRIYNDEVVADPRALLQALETDAVSVVETVPSLLRALLAETRETGALPTLRWMLATGEALTPDVCRAWKQFAGDRIRLLNAYGPTECSDDVTHYEVRSAPDEQVVRMPIGRALANTQLYIVDREMQPVPVGVSGELCVGGDGVGRGYLHDTRRSAESFVPNQFSDVAGERLYRTGDLCRYLPDGEIEFLGRIDDQVKLRGFRIELGEIEAALSSHDAIEQAAVVVREDNEGDKRLVAYIVAAGEQPVNGESALLQDDLREYLKAHLPEYMTPQVFVMLEALPLTPNGKLDRRSLPAPDYSQARAKKYQAPRTETETIVAEIWSDVLGEQQIGVDDNFFSVGGHSLLATQVISRIRQRFEIELPLRAMFESPTIAELSLAAERAREQQIRTQTPALTTGKRRQRKLDQLLTKVQSLSEAEARQTLDQIRVSTTAGEHGYSRQ
ncbi:MAG TPA: amino acid adenylation domain-containing protein [Pyrinomonadaceae bacterium]|nr:amino acid adenylation domain-containing protein [Pyrinomonadaceae bacterium]